MIALCILAGAVITNPADPSDGQLTTDASALPTLVSLNCNFNTLNAGRGINVDYIRNCAVAGTVYVKAAYNSTFENVTAERLEYVFAYRLALDRQVVVNQSVARSVSALENKTCTGDRATIYLKDGLAANFNLTSSILVVLPSFTGELTVNMSYSRFEAHNFAGKRLGFINVAGSKIFIEAYGVQRQNFIAQLQNISNSNIYINIAFGYMYTGTTRICRVVQDATSLNSVYMNVTASIVTRYELDFSVFEQLGGESLRINSTVFISSSLKQQVSMIGNIQNSEKSDFNLSIFFKDMAYQSADSYDVTIYKLQRGDPASLERNCFSNVTVNKTSGENYNYTMKWQNNTVCNSVGPVSGDLYDPEVSDPLFDFDYASSTYGYFNDSTKFSCSASQAVNWNDLTCIDLETGSSTEVNFTTLKIACFACFGAFLLAVLVLVAMAIYYCCRSGRSTYDFKKTAKEVSVKIPSDNMDQDLLSQNQAYTEEVLISYKPDTVYQLNLNDPQAKKNYAFRQISDIDDSSEDEDYMKLMNEQMKIQQETVKDVYKGEELFDNTNIFRYTTKNKGRDRLQKVTFDETLSEVAPSAAQNSEPAAYDAKDAP